MLTTLKKLSGKAVRTRVNVAMIIVIGAIALVNSSVLSLITGPVVIDADTDFDALKGKYVEYTAKYFIDEYVRQSTKTEGKNDEKLKNIGYLLYDEASGYFFGAEIPSKNEQIMNDHIDETWVWLSQDGYEMQGSETFRGTWTELTGKRLQYFQETITEDLGEDFMQIAVPYYIDTNKIGKDIQSKTMVCLIVAGAAFLYVLYILFRHFTNSYDKSIKKFISQNPGVTMDQIDSDFRAAQKVSSNIWVGNHYTIFGQGIYAEIIDNTKLVWAYYYRRTGRNSVSQLRTYNVNKQGRFINASEADAKKIMEIYAPEQHQMILGYDKNWEKMYNKDFKSFLNLQYYKGMQMRQEAEFTGAAESFGSNQEEPVNQESSAESTYTENTYAQPKTGSAADTEPATGSEPADTESDAADSASETDSSLDSIGSSFDSSYTGFDSFSGYSSFDTDYGKDSSSEEDSEDEEKKED